MGNTISFKNALELAKTDGLYVLNNKTSESIGYKKRGLKSFKDIYEYSLKIIPPQKSGLHIQQRHKLQQNRSFNQSLKAINPKASKTQNKILSQSMKMG